LGSRAWLGVLLGSFAVNIAVGSGASQLAARSVIALCIAAGATVQALLGARLIRRSVGFPHPLQEGPDVLRFSLLGGPVACLVNATVGSTTLLWTHAFQPGDFLGNWVNWW